MLKIWQLFQDLNNLLNSPEWIEKRQQIGDTLIAIGTWLKAGTVPIFGSSGESDTDYDEAIGQVVAFIDGQGGVIPMAAPEMERGERLIELLKIAIPLLFKLL